MTKSDSICLEISTSLFSVPPFNKRRKLNKHRGHLLEEIRHFLSKTIGTFFLRRQLRKFEFFGHNG